jgi:hypothetical protein
MFLSKKNLPAIAVLLAPLFLGVLMALLMYQSLLKFQITEQKLAELVNSQIEAQNTYIVEIETFDSLNGRLIYVPMESAPNYPTANREYNSQVANAFASCDAGEECIDSVHVWLYRDSPKGTIVMRDTALSYGKTH